MDLYYIREGGKSIMYNLTCEISLWNKKQLPFPKQHLTIKVPQLKKKIFFFER